MKRDPELQTELAAENVPCWCGTQIPRATHPAEYVAVIVEAWQKKLDACGLELWQRNAATHKGKWGEGPIDLASLASDAVRALGDLIDDSEGES